MISLLCEGAEAHRSVTVHHHVDFAAAMIDGRVARELNGKSRSAEEITLLCKYVDERIRKVKKDG